MRAYIDQATKMWYYLVSTKGVKMKAVEIQRIMNQGFNNRERWSDVPKEIQEEVRKIISSESYEKAMTYKKDIDRYYFILGVLHAQKYLN